MPKATGLGFGSLVRPMAAMKMMISSGPEPTMKRMSPAQKRRERRNFVAGGEIGEVMICYFYCGETFV